MPTNRVPRLYSVTYLGNAVCMLAHQLLQDSCTFLPMQKARRCPLSMLLHKLPIPDTSPHRKWACACNIREPLYRTFDTVNGYDLVLTANLTTQVAHVQNVVISTEGSVGRMLVQGGYGKQPVCA